MKNQNLVTPGYLMAMLCLVLNFNRADAQTQTARYVSMISNSNGFYEYLPQGYSTESQSYPLLVFLHGVGELGIGNTSTLPTVLRNGPPKLINSGTFPVSFTVNSQVYKFIVISPQFINWPSAADVQGIIDYAVRTYRVNTNRIYLTGLSMGGGVTWDYASYNAGFANRIAAIVPVCGASGPTTAKAQVMASANLPVWATHNQVDPTVPVSNTNGFVDAINASSPGPGIAARKTIFQVSGHDAWTATYTPAFRENNLNVYEWMLQYQRGTALPVNQLPVANAGADFTITLPANGITLAGNGSDPDGSITGYSWTKISGPAQFSFGNSNSATSSFNNLVAGDYTLRLTVTDNAGGSAFDEVNVKVNPAASPVIALPARIEAENYSAMSGVQAETTSDAGGGRNVGFIDTGDWMDYAVSVSSAGTFTVNLRIASPYTAQQLLFKNTSGAVLSTVSIPQTGAFQNWTTVTTSVTLPAGNQTLRISSGSGGWNINWFELLSVVQSPVSAVIPGKIEAENYNSMNGILTENTTDAGAGRNVGFIDTGDWMDYSATVTSSGTYTVNFRVASPYAARQLQLRNSTGTVLAVINVPQTGAFQNWTSISAPVTLPAGNQTLRVYSVNGGCNINWIEFIAGAQSPVGVALPAKIEAENYNDMSGILTETTSDIGGGRNVGWVDNGDWLDFQVSVAATSGFTVNFRVATPNTSQQLQLRNSSGAILATIAVPQTGSYQSWTTVTATISLAAGNHTLRIYSSNGGWNLNWLEFISGNTTPPGAPIPGKIEAEQYNAMNGIGIENTADAGGGSNIGWIATGDWMDYNTYVAASGNYTVNFRLATAYSGQQLQLRNSSGAVLATVTVPQTGGFQTWATVSATVNLSAGSQTLRIYSLNGSWNLNWFECITSNTSSNAAMPLSGIRSQDPEVQRPLTIDKEPVSLYPNPVRENLSLELNSSHTGPVSIEILDMNGKSVQSFRVIKNLPSSIFHLPVNALTPGMYFIKVQTGNRLETKKMIKK